MAERYAASHDLECLGGDGPSILAGWHDVLNGLTSNPETVADVVDWVAKKRVVDAYAERHGLRGYDVRTKALDLQYHDMRHDKSISARVGLRVSCEASDVRRAMVEPPDDTRAYFRGRVLAKWPESVVAANWDSIVFDVGRDPLRRVPMMEPLRGTRDLVGDLLEASLDVTELLERLGD
jgi:proteasome accessory factor A